MNKQQTVSRGLLYGTVPPQFAQLNICDDLFEDEFDCDEPETRFAGESLASYLMAFQNEMIMEQH